MNPRRWPGQVSFQEARARLQALGYTVSFHLYAPGTVFAAYPVTLDRVEAVLSGCLRLQIDTGVAELGPAEWLEITRGCRLAAEVMGEEPVLALDGVRLADRR